MIKAKFIAIASRRTNKTGERRRKMEGIVALDIAEKTGTDILGDIAKVVTEVLQNWDFPEATHLKISVQLQPGKIKNVIQK